LSNSVPAYDVADGAKTGPRPDLGVIFDAKQSLLTRSNHSGLMPFASMNVVQFLISAASLVRNAEPGA
jgi:hypothetical protein